MDNYNFNYGNNNTNPYQNASEQLLKQANDSYDKMYDAKEKASKAKIETFSNEQGKEQNQLYKTYINDSISETFSIKTDTFEERQKMLAEMGNLRWQIKEEKMQAEMDIKKMKMEANFELEKIKREIYEIQKPQKIQRLWNITCPILGVILGVAAYLLLAL